MEFINKIELQGRVGTVRTNEHNNSKVANFTLATDLLYKTHDGNAVNELTWHNVVFWEGKDTPRVNEISKGAAVYVSGRLRSNKYTSSDGTDRQFYEVLANKVKILGEEAVEL